MNESYEIGIRVHIHVTQKAELPIGEPMTAGKKETSMETALRMVDEVKKRHPNAAISVEVEI